MHQVQRQSATVEMPRVKEVVFHVACALIASHGFSPELAWAVDIVADGRAGTVVSPLGADAVDIHSHRLLGNGNALNSFSRFNVGSGELANLHVPTGSAALINLVRDQKTTVAGMLNAVKDGKIGGKIYFANPHGFVVSSSGVVNVGSLHVSTPTQQFVDDFFDAADASAAQLIEGTAPRNADSRIDIQGRVNATEQASLSAGTITVAGKVFTGAKFAGSDPAFRDVVNIQGLEAGAVVQENQGRIEIVGDTAIAVSGTLSSRRVAANQNPELLAEPSIAASGSIALEAPSITISGGKVLAAGSNGHAGGDVGLHAHAEGDLADALSDTTVGIALAGATLTGKDLTLNARAAHDSSLAPVVSKTVSASVSVDSSTLAASGATTVQARSSADISTPDFVPFATLDVDVSASVAVTGSSRLGSAGDTRLSATTTSNLEAHPGLPDFGVQPGDAGVAIVIHNSTASVDVSGTSEVGSGNGRTDLAATNLSLIDAEVDASASGESAVGGAVATSVLNSTTRARVADNAKLAGKTGVGVTAQSVTLARTVARAAAGGATERGADESKTEETLAAYEDEAATSDGSITFAAAVAVSDIDSSTLAALDSAQALQSEGALTVSSTALTQSEVAADGSSAGGSVGVGVGVALNLARLDNEARIAQQVDTAGVDLEAALPAGDEINLFSTVATAGAGASDVGVAGALAVNVLDNASAARIIGSDRVNAGHGSVSIRAENRSESNASATPAEDAAAGGETLGIGAAVALNIVANASRAELADGAALDNAGTLGLEALGEYAARTEAEAGAEGGIAATPVAAVAVIDNRTEATIGAGTPIQVGGEVRVEALQASTSETSAKASAAGEKAALGIAVAVNVINETVSATVQRNIEADGGIHLAAYSAHLSSATATASAKGGKGEDEEEGDADDGVDREVGRQTQFAQTKQKDGSASKSQQPDSAETSEGKISVAAAVAVNSARMSTTAAVADGVELRAGGALTVDASGNADASADADGSAAGSTATVGIGAAVAINSVHSATEAWIGSTTVNAHGVAVRALMTDLGGDTENTFSAAATAGAGAGKVGIAGALALNILDTRNTAEIHDDASIDAEGGEIELRAESESVTTATALPDEPASGGKLGVGASVALNLFREEQVRARIRNGAELIDLDKLSVIAKARSDTTAEAEAGAEGGVALDAVVTLSDLKLQTEAVVEAGAAFSTTGAVEISATSAGEHVATASGDTESSKVGIGASGAIILSTTRTRASLERDLTTTGSDADGTLSIRTQSSRSYEAVATASAAGGKAEDETTEAERDKAASTSTLKDNKDAQKGTETTKNDNKLAIAAAVGAVVLDDDTLATIGAGRRLELGGNLTVEASSDSDFSARGLGNTLDIDKLQDSAKVGIGVGVGLAIARNDTEASIGADSTVVKAGAIDIAAEASQNTAAEFTNKLAAEGVAGAGAEKVGIAGALAVAYSQSTTTAWLGERAKLGDPASVGDVGAVSISADNTSKLSAKAWSAARAGKVGIGASIAILKSDNAYRAGVGNGAEITAASLNLAARNHVITGAPPFDWSVLTDLENRFTETNLQILLGQNNYYTETIAGAGSEKVAVSGAFSVNVFEDLTAASIGTAAKIKTTNAVTLDADNSTTAKAFAGGIAAAGKVGVGLASADIVNESQTRASIGDDAHIEESSAIDVDAAARMDLAVVSASAAAAGKAGASGVLSLIDSSNAVEAFAGDRSLLRSTGDIGIDANNTFEALGVAGVAGIGGSAGVGVSAGTFLINNRSEAWTGAAADLAAAGLIQVGATSTQDLTSVVVGGAGGGTAGVAASAAANIHEPITQAWIGDNGRINADITDANLAGRTLRVSADSTTELLSIVGTVGIGGTAGVGGAADVVVLTKKTAAWVGEGVIARSGASLELLASSTEKMRSAGVGLSAGGTAGVQGSASVLVLDIDTLASAAAGSRLFSDGNLVIAAESSSDLDLLSGAIGAAGSAAVGAAAAVAVVDKTTHAWVDDGAAVTALGKADATQVASGCFDVDYSGSAAGEGEVAAPGITPSNGESDLTGGSGALDGARQSASATRAHRGLAVTAVNQDDIKGYAVTGAASGTGAVTLSGDVAVHTTDTQASIGSISLEAGAVRSGVRVNDENTTAHAEQSVLVAAGNDSFHLGIAGALSASGAVGVGVGADVAVTQHKTQAAISDHSTVNARRDVEVSADSTQEIVSVSASLGASGTVGVSGSVSVLGFDNTTWASIGDDTVVDAGGNVVVTADDSTSTTLVAGTVALGLGGGGIGGGVGITLIDKDTRAWIGDNARVDGRGQDTTDLVGYSGEDEGDGEDATARLRGVQVQAQSSEDLFTVSAAAAGGLYLGFAGAVSVATVDADTFAWIGKGAQVNKGAGAAHASQDVNVTARNDFNLFNVSGALGVGAAGIAGGVDVGVIRNDTTAFIGDEAQVAAARDVDVNALAKKKVESTVVSAAGGLGALAGGVGVYSMGGALGDDAQRRLETDDGDAGSYADGQATDGSIGDVLGGYDDEHIGDASQRVHAERSTTATSSRFTASENRALPAGTAAFIGQRARIDSGGNIDVDARERVTFDMRNGGIAIGAVGLGAGVGVANFRNDTTAHVGEGSVLRTAGDGVVSVSATLNENLDSLGFAGTGGVVAVDAAVAVLESDSSVAAGLENEVAIERAGDVRVEAKDERTLHAETTGVSVGLVAAGASVTTARIGGSTTASIGNQVAIGQGAGDTVGQLHVLADAAHSATATALAVKGGLGLAASGTVATARIEPTVSASVGTDTQITVSTDVVVDATVSTAARADATGVNVSLGGGVGASIARATVSPTVSATIGKRSAIEANTFSLAAHQRLPGSQRSAYASASGAAGGLLLGANASSSLADNQASVTARLDDDSTLTVGGTATVQTDNNNAQLAHVSGVSIGFIAAGANSATASSDTASHAVLGDRVEVAAASLRVLANGHSVNHAHGVAGAGGAVSAPFSASYTSTTSSTIAETGSRFSQDHADDSRAIDVNTLEVSAVQGTEFDSWMRNTNASLIGASGAKAENFASATTAARIGDTGWIKADSVALGASTTLNKGAPAGPLAGSNITRPAWNVESSSGGLADFPAAGSSTTLLANTLAEVGASAILEPHDPVADNAGIGIDAGNLVNAADRVTMASGGAVSAASGESHITTLCPAGHDSCTAGEQLAASVRVGDGAELLSEGDIRIGSRTTANLSTQTAVDVYGLVGVAPEGSSVSAYVGSNRVEIGNATLYSGKDIALSAGSSSNGAMNALSATARSDVFNNTAIPVNKDPVADAFVTSNSAVTIASGADLAAVRNIALYADKGSASAAGVGIGKDIYRETLAEIASWFSNLVGGGDVSFETRTGRSVVSQDSRVDIHGGVRVGVERKQRLHIDYDGSTIEQTDGISIVSSQTKDIYADILARIEALKDLIKDYAVDAGDSSSDAAIAVAAYQSEINFLEHKLYEMGFGGNPDEPGFNSANPLQMAQDKLDGLDAQITGLETDRTQLEAEKVGIETEVDALNQPLIADNDSLTAQNTTLDGEISSLRAEIAALDPDADDYASERQARQEQINAKEGLKQDNLAQIGHNNDLIEVNEAPLNAKVSEISAVNTRISELEDTHTKIQTGVDDGTYGDTSGTGLQAKFLQISDSVAMLGDIHVRANRLTGTGVLDAPGDASITIINEGPSFLTLGKLTIAPDAGGRLYFNGVEVHDKTAIAAINRGAGAAAFSRITTADTGSPAPAIIVENRFDPLNQADADRAIGAGVAPVAPDIVLQGAISNLRGRVAISSAAGGIRLEESASISANSVEVEALNGDFVQSYSNSFKHVAGSPLKEITGSDDRRDITLDSSGSGRIVANGSVLLAARYLNINGTIQSGIPEWGVSIPDAAKVSLPNGSRVSFDAAKAYYNALDPADRAELGAEYFEVTDASVSGLAPAQYGNWTRVTVNYNARDDRLELAGAQVQGGYIELFGQIFNTKAGGGKLRVLDGYGQISVKNDTGKTLWVNTLDAGRGAQGRIVITDITVDANGDTVIGAPQSFTRGAGEARTGVASYTPTADLRYVLSTGYDSARTDEYLYSQNGWFGITDAPIQDQYKVGTTSNKDDPLLKGEFLRVQSLADPDAFERNEKTFQVSQAVSPGASWKKCNWWTLCANATYYRQYFVASGSKTTVTGSVRADHPIGIEYIGFDAGRIDIDSVGDVVLSGSLNNRSGNTTVVTDGHLSQHGLSPILSGHTIDLSAGTGIGSVMPDGSALQAVQLRQLEGGVVNADTSTGSIYLEQKVGDLNAGRIGSAGVDKVILESARDILAHDASALVQARRIDLIADNGGIGTLDDAGNGEALRISTADTNSLDPDVLARHGLAARARGDINLSNVADTDPANAGTYSGDLLLIGVESQGGDVRIQTSGSAIDNNPYATVDTRSEDELAALWDELRLRKLADPDPNDDVLVGSDAKAQQAVDAFANGRSNNYRLYWQLRHRQADAGASYDPNYQYVLTSTERSALEDSGMGASDIDAFAANRSAQYQQLHAEVGDLTPSFDDNYRYVATDADKDSITRGASWTEAQLLLSVGAGLLKKVTDTVTTIQEPNVVGRKVTLIAGQDIGTYGPDYVIDTTAGIENLSKAERAALAATERGDAQVDDEENPRIVTLRQPQAINVAIDDRTGALSASASGRVFIGSEQDLRIDRITAGDEVRIKVAGALLNAASAPATVNVSSGGRLILEAASGGIGGTLDAGSVFLTPFGIQLTAPDAGLIARAGSDIWLAADSGLFVDTVFSIGNVRLDARGSILDFQLTERALDPALNILARNIALSSTTGMIGSPTNALDVAVSNEDGEISASTASFGQGVYLNGPQGEFFNIASVSSGDAVALSSATFMFINGRVSGPGPISLVAGASMVLTPFADVHATTLGVFLQAGDLLMEESDDGADAARIQVDVGTIDLRTVGYQAAPDTPRTAGDAVITGIYTGNPTESAILITALGSVLDGGDKRLDIIANTAPGATLTINAGGQIGGNPLDIDVLNFNASAGGLLHIDAANALTMGDIRAEREIEISSQRSISANSVTSTHDDVSLNALGGELSVGQIRGRDVTLGARDALDVYRIDVARNLALGGDRVNAAIFASGAAPITGALSAYGGRPASSMNLTLSAPGGFHLDTVASRFGNLHVPVGSLAIDHFFVGDRMVVTNPQTRMLIDQHNYALQGYDVQLFSGQASFGLSLDRNLINTSAFVLDRRASYEVLGADGPILSVIEYTQQTLAGLHLAPRASDEAQEDEAESLVSVGANPVAVTMDGEE